MIWCLMLTAFPLVRSATGPTDLAVNGLRAPDLASSPFPTDVPIVLSWSSSSAAQSFNIALVAEGASFDAVDTPPLWFGSCAGVPVLQLPSTVVLAPGASYQWRVRAAPHGPWSSVCAFETAPSRLDWGDAMWIGGASQLRTDWSLPADGRVVRARAYASGLGAFQLHINGKTVGDHVMDPGQSVYDQKVLYVGFNVTNMLKPGANHIGTLLGNSKFGYLDIYANRTAAGDQSGDATRAFILLIYATLDDGSTACLRSRATGWYVRHGPIIYDHLWHGEIYDARLELQPRWDNAPIAAYPPGTWAAANAMQPKAGRLFPQMMPPIRITETLPPVVAPKRIDNASFVYDFGTNMAGFTTLTFDPALIRVEGDVPTTVMIRVMHTEIVDIYGTPENDYFPGMEHNLPGGRSSTCNMSDWYLHRWYECANQTTAFIFSVPASRTVPYSYTPTFTYHGFQFAKLSATILLPDGTEAPLAGSLAASFPWDAKLVAHRAQSDLRQTSIVRFGDTGNEATSAVGAVLGGIFNATLNAHVSQLWSIPTDCPQREKRGWMGDAGITASSLGTFYDALAFHTNFMRLIADDQRKGCADQPTTTIYHACTTPTGHGDPAKVWFNGSMPDVTPFSTGPYGSNPGTVDWQAAYVMIAHSVLVHNGVAAYAILNELFDSLDMLLQYFEKTIDGSGLLLTGARGDWIPPQSQKVRTTTDVVAAFTHTLCLSHMVDIARAIGKVDAAAKYAARFEHNRNAFHTHFFKMPSATRCCYSSGSQAANIFALRLGAVPPEHLNETLDALLDSFGDSASPHLDIGIFGTTYVFDVLRKHDLDDVGLRLLNETSYPSFGKMVSEGATTLWEAWEGDRHHQVNSRNHIMFGGGVNRFLAATVGGLEPFGGAHGWQRVHVKLAPWAVRHLGQASSERRSLFGTIHIAWRNTAATGRLNLNVTLPAGMVGVVDLPLLAGANVPASVLSMAHEVREVPRSREDDQYVRVEVGSGTHAFDIGGLSETVTV